MTKREYIWLDDLPVAVIDQAAPSPVTYYVHTDHLMRPVAMTNAGQSIAWSVTYTPFGAVQTITAPATNLNLRFPGQLFLPETGLHYNWHRHYDPTTGRHLQPDPLEVDDGAASVGGLSTVLTGTTSSVGNGALIAGTVGRVAPQTFLPRASTRALLPDGPSAYGYARQSPLTATDSTGLLTSVAPPSALTGGFSPIPNTSANACEAPPDDCDKLHEIDTSTRNGITRMRGKRAGAICHDSAAERYAECLRDGISGVKTPLSTWNN